VGALVRSGTPLLPLFSFDFADGAQFDLRTTPSQMGGLLEAARVRPGIVRTVHTIFSLVVIGHYDPLFSGIDNRSGCGPDSPFAVLRQLEGSIASLDLEDRHSMTFHHHAEEMLNVPHRYFKTFLGRYTYGDEFSSVREYDSFVRKG
jgi:aminoglycoside N3'-acetyltransferase